jgi:SAM-dependent methyltransferase
MRETYRRANNKDYWEKRWFDIPADEPMENENKYPLKYAKQTVDSNDGRVLEAGCGAGRVLRYYKERGYDILGIDFIEVAVRKLKEVDPELAVEVGDITNLKYEDNFFQFVLSFGLYHNLKGTYLEKAVKETYRVLTPGGKVCASFRADNIQTKLTDGLAEYRSKKEGTKDPAREFHKMNLTKNEFAELFERFGFLVEDVYPVVNMPILYKFPFFRKREHQHFDENVARKEGYQLSPIGNIIQNSLMKYFPEQFCNINVLIAKKPTD